MVNLVINKPAEATKYETYKTSLNPSMNVHKIYSANLYIPDFLRCAFTRTRLMSHNLKVETGRWSRIPRESRLCQCDSLSVQTEQHVLIDCILSRHVRGKYNINTRSLETLFSEEEDEITLCKYIHETLKIYQAV